MLVIVYTSEFTETFDVNISNLLQLKDYLINNDLELWNKLQSKKVIFAVADSSNAYKEQIILPTMAKTCLSNFDILLISEKVEGEFIASLTAFLAINLVLAGMGGTLAVATATLLTAIITIGIVYGIGQLIQMLMPTQKLDRDPSVNQKNLVFNGIPNTKEQGGSVPLIFGECYFGGVQIGVKLSTVDYIVGRDIVYDELPRYTSVNGTRMEKTGTNYVNTGNPYIQATWARVY